jgi:SulP family sulfate permease
MGRASHPRLQAAERSSGLRTLPAAALRAVLREGYGVADFKADALAGFVVGIVALPLAMALAIAVGAPPQNGLYTAIVAGLVVAPLGGSRCQVSGPTAAFVVVLAPICAKFGIAGLLVSGCMGGLILILLGLLRLGRLIQFVPHPVTTGFTAGIATVIATLQIKDLMGLRLSSNPEHFVDRIAAMWRARGTLSFAELGIGLFTLALLVVGPRITRRVPAPLLALPLAALVAAALPVLVPSARVATIATRFAATHGIPRLPPLPMLPWLANGAGVHALHLDLATLRDLLPGAFAIAVLGAIESLLSAVVADGMTHKRHDPDAELLAQGVGNVVAPFFGGIPATGALARTATNIRSGGRSPIAAAVHSVTVLVAVLAMAPLIGALPMASLAALLLLVAWNMSEAKHAIRIVRIAPRSDVAVLATCFLLTVVFDMVISVTVGVVLAALLFMKRMAEVTEAKLIEGPPEHSNEATPEGVVVYDIAGPLFFGAAEKAMGILGSIAGKARVVVLELEAVPAIDATGIVALESALAQLRRSDCLAVLSGPRPQPAKALAAAGIVEEPGSIAIRATFAEAMQVARDHLGARVDRKRPPRPGIFNLSRRP